MRSDDVNDTTDGGKGRDYKQTLNLPQTEFPMQAGLATREPLMLAGWEANDLYAQVQAATTGRTKYWFVDGPPYANGDIHIGHAVNKVLKDMVVKAARLDGHHAPFVPGWDCHGLPIELQVEKKFGKVGEKLNAAEFRAVCRKYAQEQIERQRADFKRLGILADWQKPYLTMQPAFEAEQLRVLARIVENGHIVRGFKPVHWCLDCGSSLAEAEVEYQDKQSYAIDVGFKASNIAEICELFGLTGQQQSLELLRSRIQGISLVIWTTTPWTLPANQGIAVNPELDYVLVQFDSKGLIIVAEGLLDSIASRYGDSSRVLGRVKGQQLEGVLVKHPLSEDRLVPVILGDHVSLEAGTGLVHTAPAHGLDDYLVGTQKYKLSAESPLLSDGKFSADTPVVGGQHVRKADDLILAELRKNGALVHETKIKHSFPHCWRHKTPLIFRATPQWFMAMDGEDSSGSVRIKAVKAIDQDVSFIPDWGRARIHGMVSDRPDWCISRQRTWGVPLALIVDKKGDLLDPQRFEQDHFGPGWQELTSEELQRRYKFAAKILRKVADQVETKGVEAWFSSKPSDWLKEFVPNLTEWSLDNECVLVRDTLDVWFDSGSVHQCAFVSTNPMELDANGLAPLADMYLEGSDQHRGWFQSSLLTSIAMRGRAPYKTVLTHGFTVDEQGRKMSKSLGNVVAPQTVTKTLGADVLRLWVAGSDYSGEIAISDNLLKRIADAYRRIRNTARYLLSNLDGFDPAAHLVAPADMVAMDRWALASAAKLQAELKDAYGNSEFHQVYQKLHNYCVVDLGGLYLDVLKDRLYTCQPDSRARRSAQSALFHIAEAFTRWIAPILSFTADEIWKLLPGDRTQTVFAQTWYAFPATGVEEWAAWERLAGARDGVKKILEELRGQSLIGSGLDADVTLYADGDLGSALAFAGDELRFWFITSGARLDASANRPSDAIEALVTRDTAVLRPSASPSSGSLAGDPLWIAAAKTEAVKCSRCWQRRPDVGSHAAHPELCDRCIENIDGAGEVRRYI
ncbi:MAG: isoleucine--tRNA ligase [Nevskia sp.]